MADKQKKVIVIGSGIAGMAAALRLHAQGFAVEIFEANSFLGGKLSDIQMDDFRFDAGPSLFTLPELLDELFLDCGEQPRDYFSYKQLPIITRYFYEDGLVLNAFADPNALAAEIGNKTEDSAATVLKFLDSSKKKYELVGDLFLKKSLHKSSTFINKKAFKAILSIKHLEAFRTMHKANKRTFKDYRVVQLFDRYATYNGSNPYQAPATLNIIPHLEHNLGAFFPVGGMIAIRDALVKLLQKKQIPVHLNSPVSEIVLKHKKVEGVKSLGEFHPANLVVSNADISKSYSELMPEEKLPAFVENAEKSTSAIVFFWAMKGIESQLELHNVLFSANYKAEFQKIWEDQTLFDDPTVYIYISSKEHRADAAEGCENWFVMINTPPNFNQNWEELVQKSRVQIIEKINRVLKLKPKESIESRILKEQIFNPQTIEKRSSSLHGSLYGNSSNNKFSAFLRHPNFSSKTKGLYFCGGSVHPGGGIPLCLLSAKIVAEMVEIC